MVEKFVNALPINGYQSVVGAVFKLGFQVGVVKGDQVGIFKSRCAGRGVVDILVSIFD
jgi:hypothetical protein